MSDKNLSKKVAVVTGGADGIGEGIARTLRGRGAHVVIADVQKEKGALETFHDKPTTTNFIRSMLLLFTFTSLFLQRKSVYYFRLIFLYINFL